MDGFKAKTIFVQIPAYRDSELVPTLIDLVDRAAHPARLHISVCWQHGDDDALPLSAQAFIPLGGSRWFGRWMHVLERRGARVDVLDYAVEDAIGCGWARAMAQRRFDGEDYTLQIDAHHRFVDGWDDELIHLIEGLRSRSARPVVVGYPPGYDPAGGCDDNHYAMQIDFKAFSAPFAFPLVTFSSSPIEAGAPVRARFFSGGFAFADGGFVRDVPADPVHYFSTEELSLTVRAYTHGYDLFHPHRHVLWHFYGRSGARRPWDRHAAEALRRERVATAALAAALGMWPRSPALPALGLGTARTLEEYERYAGLCFAARAVTPEVLARTEPDDRDRWLSRKAWLARLRPVP